MVFKEKGHVNESEISIILLLTDACAVKIHTHIFLES